MGFLPALRRIIAALPRRPPDAAVLGDAVRGRRPASRRSSRASRRVSTSRPAQVVAATVTHQVHPVAAERKRDLLTHILTQHGVDQALVFCKTKRGANRVGEDLERRGVRAGVIHGNKSQGARNRALGDFKAGRVRVLVATDIAARGLDIAQLPLVVNFDLPLVAEDYMHRVGRTGRAGQHGRAVSLVSAAESRAAARDPALLPAPLERVAAPIRMRRKSPSRSRAGRPGRTRPMAPGRRAAPLTGAAIGSSAPAGATAAPAARARRPIVSRVTAARVRALGVVRHSRHAPGLGSYDFKCIEAVRALADRFDRSAALSSLTVPPAERPLRQSLRLTSQDPLYSAATFRGSTHSRPL